MNKAGMSKSYHFGGMTVMVIVIFMPQTFYDACMTSHVKVHDNEFSIFSYRKL